MIRPGKPGGRKAIGFWPSATVIALLFAAIHYFFKQGENVWDVITLVSLSLLLSYSMLRTMDEGYKVIAQHGEKLNPLASFWQLTAGNAEALSIDARVGRIEAGKEADIVVLNAKATPAMRLRMERITTLAEELFLLQTLGDDRAVVETYVAGRAAKSVLPA